MSARSPQPATALIAEDAAPQRRALHEQLLQAWPGLEIVAVCEDGVSALEAATTHRPTVAFLDIRMPGVSGLDVARAVVEQGGLVVFTTAYDDYAVRAFDAGAVDYLLKPVQPARLEQAVARLRERLQERRAGADGPDLHSLIDGLESRLRPQGAQGPLVVTVDSFERYQREEAWTWEHMALLRARPVYGSDAAKADVQRIIGELLAIPRDPAKLAADAAEIAGLTQFVNRHPKGFDMLIGERGESLSGGQRQEVAIARAVLMDPSVLFFDESTSAMDFTTEAGFKERLRRFAAHKTMVIVTHRSSLIDLATRMIVVDDGRIVADGPREKVVQALQSGRIGRAQ